MKISTRGKYGLQIILEIALNNQKTLSLRKISDELSISYKYSEKIVSDLLKANLINSKRGSTGGYYLSLDPTEITVDDILKATEGNLNIGGESLNSETGQIIAEVWTEIERSILKVTKNITLQELTEKYYENKNFTYII